MNSLPRAGLRIGLSWASEPLSKVITSAPLTAIEMLCFILPATAWIKTAKPEQSESPERSSYCGRSWLLENPSSRRPSRAARKAEGHRDHSPQRPFFHPSADQFFRRNFERDMLMRRCPKCGSDRIRQGYKRTYWLLRLFGIYNLLCDHCNWLFTGFVLPGTAPRRVKRPN